MCGFIGGWGRGPIDTKDIQQAMSSLNHRGPDGSGVWLAEGGHAFLAHARLSIIGTQNGQQPFSSSHDKVHVVVNGEFYGYRGIRQSLQEEGARFETDSDSEIALHLYQRRGLRMTEALRGEFALLIADERRRSIIAIRDRFGIKPLFYAVRDGAVYFASEIKALLALGVPARWDVEAAYQDAFIFRSHERTSFADIRAVPPGCYAVAQDGEVKIYPYWDWDFPSAEETAHDTRTPDEVTAGFRHLLQEAVDERLVADVEVGCYLSGGIDSSAVLGLAQGRASRPIRAFTLSFDDPGWDETEIARKQAEFVGATFHPLAVTRRDLADAFADAVWHAETPILNGHGPAKFLLSKFVRDQGLKVVLTGEGADELLSGYAPFRRDALIHHPGQRSESETQALLDEMFASNPATRSVFLQRMPDHPAFADAQNRLGWVPSFMESYGAMGLAMTPFYRAEVQKAHPANTVYAESLDRLPLSRFVAGRDRLHQALYINAKHHLPNYVLTVLGDRMEMAHAIEGRVPFLDHKVAEYAASVPVSMKVHGNREKHVLREATKDVLIDEIYHRQKHPFASPPTLANKDPMMAMFEDVLASQALNEQPIFDPMGARMALEMLKVCEPDKRPAVEAGVQRVVSTVLMHQRFGMS